MKEKYGNPEHCAVLDGLRGFAAISVVLFHFGLWLRMPGLACNAYLAVDFFFCLSGYVLARAYGGAGNQGPGFLGFVIIRLIRLMPLMILATIVSALFVALRIGLSHRLNLLPGLGLATLLGLLNLPYLDAAGHIGGPEVFPLNGPQYTLFFELFVNFVWFPIRAREPLAVAAAVTVVCWLLIIVFGYGGDQTTTFWLGFPRAGASFFAGVALFGLDRRYQMAQRLRWLFWPLFAAMAVLFFDPQAIGVAGQFFWIMVVSPLLVLTGSATPASGLPRRVCLTLGAMSYPVYVLQYPIFSWIDGVFRITGYRHDLAFEAPVALVSIGVLGAAAATWIEAPFRRRLSVRLSRFAGTVTPRSALGEKPIFRPR
jgi:peptidoglycan/LPS O-acetylase OafA/YrhL